MDHLFTIGRLSELTGVSARSIRYYEHLGLLNCTSKSEAGYRLFENKQVEKLQQIKLLMSLGFTLNEISNILNEDENMDTAELLDSKLSILNENLLDLQKQISMLEAVTRIYKGKGVTYLGKFHLIKEMISMNTRFIKIYSRLELPLKVKVLKELYETGSLSIETLRAIGEENGHLLLEELHLILVKSLMNGIDAETEKEVMTHLNSHDKKFAKTVMKSMFTFDDLGRLPDKTLEVWIESCDDDAIVKALIDGNKYVKSRILFNMDKTRADILNQRILNEQVTLDESFMAMENLLDVLRQLETKGEIIIDRFEY